MEENMKKEKKCFDEMVVKEEVVEDRDSKDCTRVEGLCQSLDVMAVNESVKALKASFDRFGDDLSELIVSYLTIEDKFRFECLSKQWRRLVFNKQYVWKISRNDKSLAKSLLDNNYKVKNQSFEKCLRKLWALFDIEINVITDGEVLRIIAENCHHLRRLDIALNDVISDESIEYFGQKCGQNIKSLALEYDHDDPPNEKIRHLLSFTSNLVSLKVSSLDSRLLLKPNSDILLPKLTEIECNYCSIEDMIEISNKYCNQLLTIKAFEFRSQNLIQSQLISCLGRFRRLQTLELNIRYDIIDDDLVQQFRQMAENCRQLDRKSVV